MGDYVGVVLENVTLDSAHVFMYNYTEGSENAYMKETYMDVDIIKPKTHFLDDNIVNTRFANRVQEVKLATNALNKTKVVEAKSQVPGRKQVAEHEGADSS